MPSLPCGCRINVSTEGNHIVFQADQCPLHETARELLESLTDIIFWIAAFDLTGLTVDQVDKFREAVRRARQAVTDAGKTPHVNGKDDMAQLT